MMRVGIGGCFCCERVKNVGKIEKIWWFRKKVVSLQARNIHIAKYRVFRVVK